MPPLAMHIGIAQDTARIVKDKRLTEDVGNYLLGATAPDIRTLLRCDRRVTHFFDIHNYSQQNSIAGLFEANPHLRETVKLTSATVTFLCGYLTHLVLDEEWINRIYRPYFGIDSPLRDDEQANLMDRVLQYELDRRYRMDQAELETLRRQMAQAVLDIEVGFLERETLERWREVALDIVSHPPDWERFRFIAGRHLRSAGLQSPEALDELMKRVPEILQEAVRHVSPDRLSEYMEVSTRRAIEAVREYLQ